MKVKSRKMRSAIFGDEDRSVLSDLDKLRAEEYSLEIRQKKIRRDIKNLRKQERAVETLLTKIRAAIKREEKNEQTD